MITFLSVLPRPSSLTSSSSNRLLLILYAAREPPPHVSVMIDLVAYWLDQNEDLVKPDQLKRLKAALEIASADRAAYKKAKRSRRR